MVQTWVKTALRYENAKPAQESTKQNKNKTIVYLIMLLIESSQSCVDSVSLFFRQ